VGSKREYTFEGETKSLNAWANDPRCRVSRKGLERRLNEGWDFTEALLTGKTSPPGRGPGGTAWNKGLRTFKLDPASLKGKTIKEVADVYGCSIKTAAGAFKRAGVEPLRGMQTGRPAEQYVAFNEKKTLPEWVKDARCVVNYPSTLHFRIHRLGIAPEDAISADLDRNVSRHEKSLSDFLERFSSIERNVRTVIPPYELDILVPEQALAIEFNGLYWHSEKFKERWYHHAKWKACAEAGIQLVQIWEDDWLHRQAVVEKMLLHKMGASSDRRVYARQAVVDVNIPVSEARAFLVENHLQGFAAATIHCGLRSAGGLVALMSLKKNGDGWDLVRYATSLGVPGGFSKLLSVFRKEYSGVIKTFADLTVSNGDLYRSIGFVEDGFIPPDYKYVIGNERRHKFNYRLDRFRDDPNLLYEEGRTERELADLNGFLRIWDAGKLRFVVA
jgi:hypothetical protein